MKRKGFWFRWVSMLTVLSVALWMGACSSAGSGGGDGTPSVSLQDFHGSWLKAFDPQAGTFEFVQSHSADTMLFEFRSPDQYIVTFYEQGDQAWEGGQKGTYRIVSSSLELIPSEYWDNVWTTEDLSSNWINDLSDYPRFPFTLSGSNLTVTIPFAIPNNSQVTLTKVSFSRPAELLGSWSTEDSFVSIHLQSDGTYELWIDNSLSETGTAWGVTGNASGYFKRETSTSGKLGAFTFSEGTFTLHPGKPQEQILRQSWEELVASRR